MNKPTEIFFEITRIGQLVKVTAIDADTGTEVVIQGPSSAGLSELQGLAKRKLNYVMKKALNKNEE